MTHKHEDLKLTAVRYYLDNDTTYAETCRIFNCSERSLKRWIDRFQDENEIKRHIFLIKLIKNMLITQLEYLEVMNK